MVEKIKSWRLWGGMMIIQILFGLLLTILSLTWGLILFAGGQPKIIAWWFVMFFGIVGVSLFLLAFVLLVKRGIQRQRPENALLGLLVLSVLAAWPAGWSINVGQIAFPADIDKVKPAVSVRWPVNQPAIVGWGGDSLDVNYHIVVPAERWAYDLVGQPAAVESLNLEDYGIYGMEVVAPANGTVVAAQGDALDLPPGIELDSRDAYELLGNYVFIRLDETQTYLVIAHLMHDSVLVQPGQRVTEGETIARAGNTGASSEPHIHIHHQRQDPSQTLLLAEGLPLYFRDTDGPPMPTGGIGIENGCEVPIGQIVTPLNP